MRSTIVVFTLAVVLCFAGTPAALGYVSPATGKDSPGRVTRAFDNPERDWLPGHRGVDLAMPPGTPVHAAGPGEVIYAGVIAGTPVVSIQHSDGLRSTYQPVAPSVRQGQFVEEGDVIGTVMPGHAEHDGLHWGVKTGPKSYINPLSLLDQPVIRLKPVR
ncbi:M23 family metallopeptidase [Corynebacterium gerontici]|uniref:Murein DD-endopeptidase MepM n=1 Tax=Corynebacterium gerontici TaxID=2079234 RepID=A0A3G6J6P7_9CORY|nr:M23 family metallopeptidase [Corynebacterium gerontici]AZA11684.1 Murein DD-endopeptidase MepM [Corynebacterium gerontici]